MPTHIPKDTAMAINAESNGLTSRSLMATRFAEPLLRETDRKDWFEALSKLGTQGAPNSNWLPPTATRLYARLQSRLLINLAEGVMENANVHLDRYGWPFIPGTAVKGCARRMALQALHDWMEARKSNPNARPAEEDVGAPCCKAFSTPSEMLAAISKVFGWVSQDWTAEKNNKGLFASDFGWAVHGEHTILQQGKALAGNADSFAGSIAFIEARPNRSPRLELDVLTPHHTDYYASDLATATATDTESPVPVYFPAVAAQAASDYFTFPLMPLRETQAELLVQAEAWLKLGLEIFGLGAKTNAGYGVFDCSGTEVVAERLKAAQKAEVERNEKLVAEAEAKKKVEAEQAKKAAEAAAMAGMTPAEQADYKLDQMTDAQFDGRVRAFLKKGGPAEEEKKAIIRAMRGKRLSYWTEFKQKAVKGDLATIDQAIRALNKTLNGDKLP